MINPVLYASILIASLSGILHGKGAYDFNEKTSIAWTSSWSADDQYVALGNDQGELAIYETGSWKKIKSWKYESTTFTRVEWNPEFPILAAASITHGSKPSKVQFYDIEQDKVIGFLPDSVQGRGVSWSPDGETAAFVGMSGKISLYSKEGRHQKTLSFTHPNSLMDIDWHPKENLLLVVEEHIYLIDIDKDSLLATYTYGQGQKGILCCQWHPSGEFFVTGDYGHENEGGEPSYLRFWTRGGKLIKQLHESRFEYRNLRWRKPGDLLAASADVLLIINQTGSVLHKIRFDNNNLWGLDWNHKGDRIIVSDQSGNIRITDEKGNIQKKFRL